MTNKEQIQDLIKQLNICAGMIDMGERISFGSDTRLMRESTSALSAMLEENKRLREALKEIEHFTGCLWPQNETTVEMGEIAKQALEWSE